MFILAGAFQVFGGFGEDGIFAKILGIALGILMLFLGLSLTLHPLEGMISLATLVTILFAASGITRLISAFQMQKTSFFWPMLISGAFSVILAGYIVANFFEIAPSLLGLLLGIELLLNGMGLIILALFLRTNKNLINN
jgi:uncharacterized membrane protein HdeD (DUF308 family)